MDAITGKSEMILYKTEDGEVKLGELVEGATCKDYLQVQNEGKRQVSRARKFYNFRQWATQRLNEYLVKGFTMDDERLKQIFMRDWRQKLDAFLKFKMIEEKTKKSSKKRK